MEKQASADARHDVTALVEDLLIRGLATGASDLHFEPTDRGMFVRARVDGQLVDFESIPGDLAGNVVSRLKILASLLTYRVDIPQEGSFRFSSSSTSDDDGAPDLRVATFPTIRGERAVVRVFRPELRFQLLDSLGMADEQVMVLRKAVSQPSGLIVLTGPAGSGKTTTLYALLRELHSRHPERSVIALEDPVEQRIDGVTQIQINPHGELSYERCMRSLLRQDPQVLLLGEVRDRKTASMVIEAALTGHLILTSIHSGYPAETIVRFLEMGIPPYQLVSALTLVCAQRLVRRICSKCGNTKTESCRRCLGTGYAGRTAVAHVVRIDEDARAMILNQATAPQLRAALAAQGPDLRARAAALAAEGITNEDEIRRVIGLEEW